MNRSCNRLVMFLLTTTTLVLAGMSDVTLNAAVAPPLKLILSTVPKAQYTTTNIPIKLTFENVSEKPVRILNYFSDTAALPVFFAFHVRKDNGEIVFLPGAGKIDFASSKLKYVTLEKKEKFDFLINLAEIVPPNSNLKGGAYTISVSYHNQYGDGFTGVLDGNSVIIKILE
jgi:hypothetical protein